MQRRQWCARCGTKNACVPWRGEVRAVRAREKREAKSVNAENAMNMQNVRARSVHPGAQANAAANADMRNVEEIFCLIL